MDRKDIVVVGASAGGVEALVKFVSSLPDKLAAAIFIVVHFPENSVSVLPKILQRHCALPAGNPVDGERIQAGRIYVAPPGCHLLVKLGTMRVVRGPKENGHRPAIDPLFRSAARAYGSRVAGIVMSGTLDDGANGLGYIKRHGGTTLVQDPEEATFPDMPRNALAAANIDHVTGAADLARLVGELSDGGVPNYTQSDPKPGQADETEMNIEELRELDKTVVPSPYVCPECKGTLFDFNENGLKHYRCRVGHAYSPEALDAHQTEELEAALWEALRAMEENLGLSRRLLERAVASGRKVSSDYYREKVTSGEERIELLRGVLTQVIERIGASDGP